MKERFVEEGRVLKRDFVGETNCRRIKKEEEEVKERSGVRNDDAGRERE